MSVELWQSATCHVTSQRQCFNGITRIPKSHKRSWNGNNHAIASSKKGNKEKKTPVYQWGSSSNEATTDKGYFPHASEDAMGFTFNWLIGTFITSELVFPLWVDRLNPFLWTTTGSSTLHQIKPLQLIPSLHETLCSTYASSRNTRHLYSHFHKLSSGPRWT